METSNDFDTTYIEKKIAKCEDIEDLKREIFPIVQSQQKEWSKKIESIIAEAKYSKMKFAELCGVSRVSVDKWCKGKIPKNRETFLKIGMAAGYNIENMNQLLQRYGRYPALYSKSLEDCICIFVITHNYGDETVNKYKYILNRIKENIIRDKGAEEMENISTVKFDSKLSEVFDEDGLEQFIKDNITIFAKAYHKFYAYVIMNIQVNYLDSANVDSIFEMSIIQDWSSSLRQCVSAIRQNKWYPTRNKIISLGLHLSMDHEQIDEMLDLAHMEPLCAKNIFESVIMFILDDASLNDMMNTESEKYDPDDLCIYARKVLSNLELPEIRDFISELPEVEDEFE